MTYSLSVDESTGVVTADPRAIEIFSSRDLEEKLGGFDPTLGQFGGDMGNGFAELSGKTFFRLVAVPVFMASSAALRFWRSLPTNTSATDTNPVVPLQAAAVEAGREFRSGLDRMKTAARFVFTDGAAFVDGVDGSVTSAGAAATQTFDSAGSTFVTDGVAEGDALVLGVIGGAGALGSNAATYRVVSITSEIAIVVEKQDGTSFDWATGASLPFRIHPAAAADSGKDHQLSEQAGALIPARPITDGQATGSSAADGSWPVSTALTPLLVPPAATATSADPLSGLTGTTGPTTTVDYDASVQGPNAVNDATLDVIYGAAADALLLESAPAREVNIVWSARKSNGIRTKLRQHVIDASAIGIGRMTVVSPELDITKATALQTVTGDAAPGVGANRDERNIYSWPPAITFVPAAVGSLLATADGKTTDAGDLDMTGDGFVVSVLSNLAPFRNPGESSATTRAALSGVLGLARNVPNLSLNSYISLRSKGIAGLRIDRTVGPVIQSGITTSLLSGQKNIARRRMADQIEDSIAARLVQLAKLPLTDTLRDTATSETNQYLSDLLSIDNPAAQEISAYSVDPISGNTPSLEAKGIFVLIVNVRTLASADFITIQANIGEGVVITQAI
jgi:hypothetical protein